jgi:ATP-dependent Clp protease ATP-binding subunit ClpC
MFERYSNRARRTVSFGRHEAAQVGSQYVCPEHLLLALVREDRSLFAGIIPAKSSSDFDEFLRVRRDELTTHRPPLSTSADLPLSRESKRILEMTSEEADSRNSKVIDTVHILLAMLSVNESLAKSWLEGLGITYAVVDSWLSEGDSRSN